MISRPDNPAGVLLIDACVMDIYCQMDTPGATLHCAKYKTGDLNLPGHLHTSVPLKSMTEWGAYT